MASTSHHQTERSLLTSFLSSLSWGQAGLLIGAFFLVFEVMTHFLITRMVIKAIPLLKHENNPHADRSGRSPPTVFALHLKT
jgi:hypothetical protein